MLALATLLLFAAPPGPLDTPPPPETGEEETSLFQERVSLEELLRRFRAEQERLLEEYRGRVSAMIADIDAALPGGRESRSNLPKYRKALIDLGPQAAPLLVPYLDPGIAADEEVKARSRQIVLVFQKLPSTRAVTDDLLKVLSQGSVEGRRNALVVLGSSDDRDRVGPVLRELFATTPGNAKGLVLASIASLGGPENEQFLGAVLADKDPQIVSMALGALASQEILTAAPRVLDLVRSGSAAAAQVDSIIAYYLACRDVVDEDVCLAIAALANQVVSNGPASVKLIEMLAEFEDEWSSKLKREVKVLVDSADGKVAEAAMIFLARTGDRTAKKRLLEPYDARIANNSRLASAWAGRADMRYKIGDYKNAIKDYQDALKTGEDYGTQQPDVYVGLARCYARMDKPKEAAEWLNKAPISIAQLRRLAEEPVFKDLAENPKYNKVFHLEPR